MNLCVMQGVAHQTDNKEQAVIKDWLLRHVLSTAVGPKQQLATNRLVRAPPRQNPSPWIYQQL